MRYRVFRRISIVGAVIALTACVSSSDPTPVSVAPSSSIPASATPAEPTFPTDTSDISRTTESELIAEGVEAFGAWVAALADGDTDLAWELMAETSRLAIGSRELFESMGSGMAEGWGSWVAVEDDSYALEVDEAGRTLLVVEGLIRPEGMEERREVGVPLVEVEGTVRVSPFEEFGNVATGLDEEASGEAVEPTVPAVSGQGRRIVYSNGDQRVWLVEADGSVADTYRVSGKLGVPAPGTYEVFSKSELAYAGYDDITMTHMVRFAQGVNLPIGFHAIPNDAAGRPLQAEEDLGEYHSAGCVRQSVGNAARLFEWADIGTPVIVLQ